MTDALYVAGDVLLLVASFVMLAFAVLFNRWARWEATETGRHMMRFALIFLAVLLVGAGGVVLTPEYTLRPYARVVVYAALVVEVAGRIRLLYRAQRPRKVDRSDREAAEGSDAGGEPAGRR